MFRLVLFVLCLATVVMASKPIAPSQVEREKSIEAVVRNKHFYKPGKFELEFAAGLLPYDSLMSQYLLGGRLDWHLTDHYGWQVVDAQVGFGSLSNYVKDLATSKGISNVQTAKIKNIVTTNFLVSPFYGKIRFFGGAVGHLDIYGIIGGGFANMETLRLSSPGAGTTATESALGTTWSPLFDIGLGLKFYLSDNFALVIDLRDYVINAPIYNSKSFKSHYTASLGLSLFLPGF